MSPKPGNVPLPNLSGDTSSIFFILIQGFRDKFPISPSRSCRLPSISRQPEGIFPSPTTLGHNEKPGFPQELRLAPHKPSSHPGLASLSQPQALLAPPNPDQARPRCCPEQDPIHSPPSDMLRPALRSSRGCAHTVPLQKRPPTPRLRSGATRAARTRQSQQAGAPLTPSAREAGSCCGGSSGNACPPPLPATAVVAAQPPAGSRPAPDRIRFTSSPPRPEEAHCPALTRKQFSWTNNNT